MRMKRDMDLVRSLLLFVENTEEYCFDPRDVDEFKEYTDGNLEYHVELLERKGLIDATIDKCPLSYSGGRWTIYEIRGLTPDGEDYLDVIRNEKVWNKTKKVIEKTIGSTTMEVIKNTAILVTTQCITKSLGM